MENKNKLTTQSYLVKRLKDMGYSIDKLTAVEYTATDKRKFSILLDNGGVSIIVTCFKPEIDPNGKPKDFGKFQFYDGQRMHNTNLKFDTLSAEVLGEYLNSKGVINKHWSYGKKQETTEQ